MLIKCFSLFIQLFPSDPWLAPFLSPNPFCNWFVVSSKESSVLSSSRPVDCRESWEGVAGYYWQLNPAVSPVSGRGGDVLQLSSPGTGSHLSVWPHLRGHDNLHRTSLRPLPHRDPPGLHPPHRPRPPGGRVGPYWPVNHDHPEIADLFSTEVRNTTFTRGFW